MDDQLTVQVAETMLRAGQPRLASSTLAPVTREAGSLQALCLRAEICLALEQHEQAAEQLLAAERLQQRGGSCASGGDGSDDELRRCRSRIAGLRRRLPAAAPA